MLEEEVLRSTWALYESYESIRLIKQGCLMMPLSLEVISYKGERSEKPISQHTDTQDLTLGRREDNSIVLPDSDKFVSSHHATISYQQPDYYITDYSSNGLYINNSKQAVGKNNTFKLSNGDQLGVGEYLIKVSIPQQDEQAPVENNKMEYDDPFADLGSDPIQKVIDENITEPTEWETPSADNTLVEKDPLVAASAHSSESDYISPLNEAFEPVQGHTEKARPAKKEEPEALLNNGIPENWMSDDSTGLIIQAPKEERRKQAAEQAAVVKQQPPAAPPPTIQQPLQPPPEPVQTTKAVEQFLLGAGLDDENLSTQITDESFFLIGKIFRMIVEGTMDVLIARNQIKSEMRLDVTTLKSVENNPVKFSFNANEALVRLLGKQKSGYMPPEQAIEEAFDDLRVHQIAVLAGMQTALQSVLKLFDPKKLEKRLQRRNPISASIPIQKRAKLWDLFEELQEDIESEAKDNFNSLFGRAFAEAYEEHSHILKQQKRKYPVE